MNHRPHLDQAETAEEKPAPKVANLKSGLGITNPERYNQHAYPPHWHPQR